MEIAEDAGAESGGATGGMGTARVLCATGSASEQGRQAQALRFAGDVPLHEVTPARCLTQRVGPKAYSASRQVPVRHRDIKGLQNGTEYHHQPTLPSIFLTVAELEPVGVEPSVGQQMLPRGVTHGLTRNRMSLH